MYRLLIADDDPDSIEKIRSLLDWPSYGVTSIVTASSFTEAAERAAELNPHVALISTHFDGHNGCELIAHLRSKGSKTVFCMISRSTDSDLIRQCMRVGAQDFLFQPLDPKELQAFLQRVVASVSGDPQPEASTIKPGIDPVLGVPYDSLSKLTNKIIQVVRNDYRSPQSLAAIAAGLDMSSKYIGRVFLKETGMKFSEYLMSYRMLEAKKRIISSREKIAVIATSVGYVQMNNFYIHFKNYFGVSPSALRNSESSQDTPSQTGEHYEELI